MAADDKLYFGGQQADGSCRGLYVSQYAGGAFTEPMKLDDAIFGGQVSGPCLSPDNRTLIVHARKDSGFGNWDLYASFKDAAGHWGPLVNLGDTVNTEAAEAGASFSPDGKDLLFSRAGDIFWVSAEVVKYGMRMNIPRMSSVFFLGLALLLPLIAPGSGFQEQGDREVIFEEIGQFNDGGMAVTVLVEGNLAYVCEFDNGLEILDIRDRRNIKKLCQVPDTVQARGITVVAGIAFVSCNVNGLKLFDVADPSKPVYLGRYEASDGDPHQFSAAGKTVYLTEWHGGVDIIDIADPRNPRRVGQFKDAGMAFSIQVVPPRAFVTEYSEGLKILDISDSSNPILVGEHNNGGETNALHVTGGKAYVCDKLQGLEILDITDPGRPALLGTFKGGGSAVGVRVVDDVALVIDWERGLETIDVRDPARTFRIGVFFDGGRPNGLQVAGDLVYLADGSDGLEIIRFRKQSKESHR